jgi:primosomal protein N''
MPPEPTYFVQIADPEDPERWHTVARVEGKELADEVVRLAQGSYMRTTVMAESHFLARALSQSKLKRDKQLAHAQWELGMGEHRDYGRALVERARSNLARG